MMDTEVNAISSPYDTSAQVLGTIKQGGINGRVESGPRNFSRAVDAS